MSCLLDPTLEVPLASIETQWGCRFSWRFLCLFLLTANAQVLFQPHRPPRHTMTNTPPAAQGYLFTLFNVLFFSLVQCSFSYNKDELLS